MAHVAGTVSMDHYTVTEGTSTRPKKVQLWRFANVKSLELPVERILILDPLKFTVKVPDHTTCPRLKTHEGKEVQILIA